MRPVAILAAMPQEVDDLRHALSGAAAPPHDTGSRTYLTGTLWGVPVVLAWSRWGKVAAAITTTEVLSRFDPAEVVFTGVAGSLRPEVAVGDIVVADALVQHDMDASPLFPRHEIPLLGVAALPGDPTVQSHLLQAAREFVAKELADVVPAQLRAAVGIGEPRVHHGGIASGDQFINDPATVADLRQRLPDALCVEMEGAAVAQVCHEHGVPFGVVRVISDDAGGNAHVDFAAFLTAASRYTFGIMRRYLAVRRG